jgi:hypothetical protein
LVHAIVNTFITTPTRQFENLLHGDVAGVFAPGGKTGGGLPGAEPLPDPNAAAQTALDAQNKERRALLASGGKTDMTGGSGMLLGSDIHSLNLGGS